MAHIFKQPDFKDTIKEFEQVSDELFQFRVIGQTGLDKNGIGLIALFWWMNGWIYKNQKIWK